MNNRPTRTARVSLLSKAKVHTPATMLGLVTALFLTSASFTVAAQTSLSPSNADELDDAVEACLEAARLIKEDDDLDGAIEEATWCLTGLKQIQEEIKLSLLPDEINGFVGGETSNQSAMGMSMIERTYSKDSESIKISLMTAGGGAAAGLGALGELGKLFGAASNGGLMGDPGGKKIRIQKRTTVVSGPGQSASLSIELKSGGNMRVESSELSTDQLIAFMRDFPLVEIDDAMKQ